MEGILSKGITFKAGNSVITGLQAIPSLGGTPNKLDITTLADGEYHYMNGLVDYGDLEFNFLLADDYSNYDAVDALKGTVVECEVSIGITTKKTFKFSAELSVSLDGVGVDAALTFTVRAALTSAITVA